jgi:hypothetical protein
MTARARRRGAVIGAIATLVVALAAMARIAVAEERPPPRAPVYTISIGQNNVPSRLRNDLNDGLVALHYADDDAASFHVFMRDMSRRAFLLTVLDADTQRRFPDLVSEARVPTEAELAAVVATVKQAMEADRAAGQEPALVLFYSGHGVRDDAGAPALALFDGSLGQQQLYDQVLGALPYQVAHVIVDACHAEAVVRPRDADARIETLPADEIRSFMQAETLARFPKVGALLASTTGAQSFEWDAYHGGVFAHEVLSGLRGGADVNGDGRIEYSELAAFLAAANLQISDPRVRPQIVLQPPRTNRRAAIVDLATLKGSRRVAGRARGPWAEPFFVEDEAGVRLVDIHLEKEARIALQLPPNQRLYIVGSTGEVEVEIEDAGGAGAIDLDTAPRTRRSVGARGSLNAAMRKGLFAVPFGIAFYRGYVSQQPELVPVPLETSANRAPIAVVKDSAHRRRHTVGVALLAGGAAAAVAAGIFGGLALHEQAQFQSTNIERSATVAKEQYHLDSILGIAAGAGAVGLVGAGIVVLSRHGGEGPGEPVRTIAFTGTGLTFIGDF